MPAWAVVRAGRGLPDVRCAGHRPRRPRRLPGYRCRRGWRRVSRSRRQVELPDRSVTGWTAFQVQRVNRWPITSARVRFGHGPGAAGRPPLADGAGRSASGAGPSRCSSTPASTRSPANRTGSPLQRLMRRRPSAPRIGSFIRSNEQTHSRTKATLLLAACGHLRAAQLDAAASRRAPTAARARRVCPLWTVCP